MLCRLGRMQAHSTHDTSAICETNWQLGEIRKPVRAYRVRVVLDCKSGTAIHLDKHRGVVAAQRGSPLLVTLNGSAPHAVHVAHRGRALAQLCGDVRSHHRHLGPRQFGSGTMPRLVLLPQDLLRHQPWSWPVFTWRLWPPIERHHIDR